MPNQQIAFITCLQSAEIIDTNDVFNKNISNRYLSGFLDYFIHLETIFKYNIKWKSLCNLFSVRFGRNNTKIEKEPGETGYKSGYEAAKNEYNKYTKNI